MKIQIRRAIGSTRSGPIRVREKTIYHCKECGNKYYSCHYFCPQCLGEVVSGFEHTSCLQIVACPVQMEEAVELLKKLADNPEYDFAKALATLPWVCITNTDPAILQHWKECLDARKIKSEIISSVTLSQKRRRKPSPPLYSSQAPFPNFLPTSTTLALRQSGKSITLTSTKLRWIEAVLLSFQILERLFKQPTGTILFYDFIFQIEQQLTEVLDSFRHSKWSDSGFLKRTAKLKDSLDRMETEIEAVRQQIQEQL